MMACEEHKSKQEAAFHAVMAETTAFRVDQGNLVLLNSKDEEVARLSPAK